ncbi:hypothetical protein TWF730_001856 [Orbilia blumenaviensis]|uniref:F-box domain-containing protein n=1 Tax=Orbilia blumenaviensis TaxID=1796055 RepID=A0AAV9UH90_9PEZI
MDLPIEVLLTILEQLDRTTLLNLRLADKYLYHVATTVAFGDFSVHYGLARSIPQMRRIAESQELRSCIRSLYLPSESFFPFPANFSLEGTRGLNRLPWFRELLSDKLPVINCLGQQRLIETGLIVDSFYEDTTNKRLTFSLLRKTFETEYNTYREALVGFLEACPRLRRVHISTGVGFDKERMDCWNSMMGGEIFDIFSRHEIVKLEISAASVKCFYMMLARYDPDSLMPGTVFPSIRSLVLRIQNPPNMWSHLGAPTDVDWEFISRLRHRLYRFLSCMPALTSYSTGNSDIMRLAIEITPVPPRCQHLRSLNLSFINFTKRVLEDFKELMRTPPPITELTLDTSTIWASTDLQEIYPAKNTWRMESLPIQPKWSFEEVGFTPGNLDTGTPTYSCSFEKTWIGINWATMFEILRRGFPKLTSFTFKRLLYSTTYSILLIPVQDREDFDRAIFCKFAKGTWDMELISVYEADYIALERFRTEVNGRRRKIGQHDLQRNPLMTDNTDLSTFSGLPHQTMNKRVTKVLAHNIWDEYGVRFGDDVYCY